MRQCAYSSVYIILDNTETWHLDSSVDSVLDNSVCSIIDDVLTNEQFNRIVVTFAVANAHNLDSIACRVLRCRASMERYSSEFDDEVADPN